MFRSELFYSIERNMLEHRVALVHHMVEQYGFPKIADYGNMGFPIELGHFGKNVTDGFIELCLGIEPIYQSFNVRSVLDVLQFFDYWQRSPFFLGFF